MRGAEVGEGDERRLFVSWVVADPAPMREADLLERLLASCARAIVQLSCSKYFDRVTTLVFAERISRSREANKSDMNPMPPASAISATATSSPPSDTS